MIRFPDIPIDEKLMVITGIMFGSKDKKHMPILPQADYGDALVDYICTLARFKLDYVMKNIMTSELLMPNISSPERVIVGLRALLILSKDSQNTSSKGGNESVLTYKKNTSTSTKYQCTAWPVDASHQLECFIYTHNTR